jgi:hypothetical protein
MNVIDFLTQLETNLNNSINKFDIIVNNYGANNTLEKVDQIHNLILKNNNHLYTYLEKIKKLDEKFFSKPIIDNKQFVLSFDIDNDLYQKNFKEQFKHNLINDINVHKFQNTIIKKKKIKNDLLAITGEENYNKSISYGNKTVTTVDKVDLKSNILNLPIIKNIKEIPPSFYWFEGNSNIKAGIYTCVTPGFFTKIPLPNVISTLNPDYKINSIPCKFETRELCKQNKIKKSEMYKSEIRECLYVHKKEKFSKIGSFYRCNIESFGNYDSLEEDLNKVSLSDIKRILMHSLSDNLLSIIWYQNKFKDGDLVLTNIENY